MFDRDEEREDWKKLAAKESQTALDAFVKIDGIDGESQDSKHKGEIEIYRWSGKVENRGSAAVGGGSGSGRSIHQGFKFVKLFDKASPKLLQACASGEHLKKVVFTVRKAGGDQKEYLTYTFSDVLVSEYRQFPWGDAKTGLPQDGFQLHYGKLEVEYKEQKQDGTLGGSVKGTWDVKQRKA